MPKEYNKRTFIYDWAHVPIIVDIPYVANLLGLSHEWVRSVCVAGTRPAHKIGQNTWRINKSDLMKFVGAEVTTA